MKTRNILYEIYSKKTSSEEATKLFKHLMKTNRGNIINLLELDIGTDWTALILYSIPLHILAQWRYEGWPTICIICCKQLNKDEDQWKAFRKITIVDHTYYNVLAHWDCYHSTKE